MLPLEVVFTTLFGLALGSFLNVCIVRLPRGESVVHPPSRCPHCGTPIRPLDNIPLLSWLLLHGQSRCCHTRISIRYPAVEALTAVLFVACLLTFGLTLYGAAMAVLCWLLLGLAFMDAQTFLLPDAFTLPGVATGLLFNGALARSLGEAFLPAAGQSLLAALSIGGALFLVATLYQAIRHRDGMGFGDVKLGALLGAWLGWKLGCVALFLAVLTGAIAGMVYTFRKGQPQDAGRGAARLPFGAFLAGSGILVIFTGKPLLGWYLGFFP